MKQAVKKPKKGDVVSLKVVGYGLVSWETATIERVKGDKVWIAGRESQPVTFPGGKGEDVLGLRVDVVFDGGKAGAEYEKSGN